MDGDPNVFFSQKLAFPDLIIPERIPPETDDDLTTYCRRLAEEIDPGQPCFVGGASFGGLIALEMTRHLDTLACFLIGSVRGPNELPGRIRSLRALEVALSLVPVRLLQFSAATAAKPIRRVGGKHLGAVMRQFSTADAHTLRWSARQVLQWDTTYEDVLVRQIHGAHDHVFPLGNVRPDEIVPGGGHAVSMTNGRQVNEFLRREMLQITGGGSSTGGWPRHSS